MWITCLMMVTLVGNLIRSGADWPVYRHDAAQTSVSPGKGRIEKPVVLWEHYLGTPFAPIAATHQVDPWRADLDGDGTEERVGFAGKTLYIADLNGNRLWSHELDQDADPGRSRIARVLPDTRGMQIVSLTCRMDTGDGQLYCFRFDRGVVNGELAWGTGPLTGQHAPTLVIDDVDGDGALEIVTAPHYRVQIFSAETGVLEAEIPWDVGRNYGILLTRPRAGGRRQKAGGTASEHSSVLGPQSSSLPKDVYVICDFVLHVDRIAYVDGKWTHVWGHKYVEPNAPRPRGREQYLRVGPNPVTDVDGDGRDEMVYLLVDAEADDRWHLRVRDAETGEVEVDLPGIWLWSVADLDGDGREELVYTPTSQKRPGTYCDLHVARLAADGLRDLAVLSRVRPLLMNATLSLTMHTTADEGLQDLLRTDLDGDGRPELFVALPGEQGRFEDRLRAVQLTPDGQLREKWRFDWPSQRLNLVYAGPGADGAPMVRVRNLTAGATVTVDPAGIVTAAEDLRRPGGFSTTPIVVDLDGDGVNEIVLQNAAEEIVTLRPGAGRNGAPVVLWKQPGVAMGLWGGYGWNGPLCPQAADLDGDGLLEVVFAAEDESGLTSVVCVDGQGSVRWRRSIEGCPWGGLQAGVDKWTFGRFTGRGRGLDVYVDLHRRSKGSGEGWLLRGDTGEVVWRKLGIESKETAMPFGGRGAAVADMNSDGIDDLIQMNYTVLGVSAGDTGEPLLPPAFLWGQEDFGKWIGYSSPTVLDLDGDGKLEIYLNSNSYARGAYAAVYPDGRKMWCEFKDNTEGSDGFGPVGDFDGDGALEIGVPVLNGTLLCLNAADGSHKWRIETPVTGDVVAADINSDGLLELVFAGRDGQIRAVSGKDGREVWAIPASGRPVIADVTGDGLVEVLAVGWDGLLRVIGSAE